jgi:hypothetical protein
VAECTIPLDAPDAACAAWDPAYLDNGERVHLYVQYFNAGAGDAVAPPVSAGATG